MEKEKAEIASLVEKYGRIQSLMKYVNSDTLKESYSKQPKGKAVGVDGVTKEQYGENLEENIENLLVRMKKFSYKPYPVRRAYIVIQHFIYSQNHSTHVKFNKAPESNKVTYIPSDSLIPEPFMLLLSRTNEKRQATTVQSRPVFPQTAPGVKLPCALTSI